MKAIANATIQIKLVTFPIKLYTATKEDKISFNLLHKECNSRINQQYICKTCENKPVTFDDCNKVYFTSKTEFLTFTKEEIAQLDEEQNKTITIDRFVPLSQIDQGIVENTYYVGTGDKTSGDSYRLVHEALRKTNKVGIGTFTMKGRDHICALRWSRNGVLVLHTLFFASDIRDAHEVVIAPGTPDESTIALMEDLIDTLTTNFVHSNFTNRYRERLDKLIASKQSNTTVDEASEPKMQPPQDIMQQLKASLERSKNAA